jgi:dUTP pyrophosphatase
VIYIIPKKQHLQPKKVHSPPKDIDSTLAVDYIMRRNVEVLFAKLDPNASAPTQGSKSAAGWDLRALEDTTVSKGSSTKIRTGIAVAIPEGWEGQIRSRSSLGAKGMIMPNGVGTIDSDYRGELMVLATWIGEGDSIQLSKGERVAQMLIAPVPVTSYKEVSVEDLSTTERGKGGFGSSGRF